MRAPVWSLLAVLCASLAVAQDAGQFDGDWTIGNPAACVLGADNPNFALRIGGGEMLGLESVCQMTNPVPVRDLGAILHDMVCEGEGDRWSYRNLLMLDREGALVMINDGYVSILSRCTGPVGASGGHSAPAKGAPQK